MAFFIAISKEYLAEKLDQDPDIGEASVFEPVDVVAKKVASSGTTIISTNPKSGPESIEGYYDEVFCIPGLLEEVLSNSEADAYIIACFDDTGLDLSLIHI